MTYLRRIPRAGWACFVVALVNAVIWGLIVPPFQVPDEISHFAYAQYLAETGKPPPQGPGSPYSPQENVAISQLFFYQTIGDPRFRGVLTPAQNRALRAALSQDPSPVSTGGASAASNQPPLYYALAAVPYWLSPSRDILGRLVFMRLLSALLAAGTVLAVFLFLRELFPRTPWAWTVGALMVAFQPMVSFIAAGVQGDNLLFFASAWTFFWLARAYRRGLTTRRAVAIGAVIAIGLLAKLTFLALIPGIALAILLLGWRELPVGRLRALGLVSLTGAVAAVPLAIYMILNLAVWHRGGVLAGGTVGASGSSLPSGGSITLAQRIDYIWELYLPRLPFMHHNYFPSGLPAVHVWLDGSIGRFGWLDYTFPTWVYTLAKYLIIPVVVLGLIGLYQARGTMRRLLPLLGCFAVMVLGLLGAIGWAGIRYQLSTGFGFAQARYIFPLLALYGLFTVLVARSAGRRWAPVLAAVLLVVALAHNLFGETITIARYYG